MKPDPSPAQKIFPESLNLNPVGFFERLFFPRTSLMEPEHRRRARLFASLLVLFIALGITVIFIDLLANGPVTNAYFALGDIIILVIAYALSRTRYSAFSVPLILVTIWGSVLAVSIINHDPSALNFLIAGVLVSSLVMSPQATILVSAGTVLTVLLLPVLGAVFTFKSIILSGLSGCAYRRPGDCHLRDPDD